MLKIETKIDLQSLLAIHRTVVRSTVRNFGDQIKQDFLYPDGEIIEHTFTKLPNSSVVIPIVDGKNIIMIAEATPRGSALRLPSGEWEGNVDGVTKTLNDLKSKTGFILTESRNIGDIYLEPNNIFGRTSIYLCYGFNDQELVQPLHEENKQYLSIPITIVEEMLNQEYILDAAVYVSLDKAIKDMRRRNKLESYEKRMCY